MKDLKRKFNKRLKPQTLKHANVQTYRNDKEMNWVKVSTLSQHNELKKRNCGVFSVSCDFCQLYNILITL